MHPVASLFAFQCFFCIKIQGRFETPTSVNFVGLCRDEPCAVSFSNGRNVASAQMDDLCSVAQNEH